MYIEALGKDFPLCYTVEAQSRLAEKAGGLENIREIFKEKDAVKTTENTIWMLSVMMQAAVNREKIKCRMLGDEYRGGEAPTYEELRMLINPVELGSGVAKEINEAMQAGQKTTVEVKEEKGKNVKTT